jgi:hypothetical protein
MFGVLVLPWFVWMVPETKAAKARVDAWVSRLGVISDTATHQRRSVSTLAIIRSQHRKRKL